MSGKTQSSGEIWRCALPLTRPPQMLRLIVWYKAYVSTTCQPISPVIMMTTSVTIEATMKVEYKQSLICRLVELKEKDDRHEKKIAARNLDSRRSHFFSRLSSPRARVTWRRGITRSLRWNECSWNTIVTFLKTLCVFFLLQEMGAFMEILRCMDPFKEV